MSKKTRALIRSRRAVGILFAASVATVAACSESTGPASTSAPATSVAITSARSLSLSLPTSYVSQGLLRQVPLLSDVSVTRTIPNTGGVISVPGTGMQLSIPAGAFSESALTFTITAHAGNAIAYDFEPHGHTFAQPLMFTQYTGVTNLKSVQVLPGFTADLRGAYFPTGSMVDPLTGIAVVTELLPTTLHVTTTGNSITFPIRHFSGYLISVGRDEMF